MANRGDSHKDRRPKDEVGDQLVAVNGITGVAKGGRRIRFVALVVIGDKRGHVGFGTGKVQEVPEVICKAIEAGKKNMTSVPIVGTTIPHEVIGHFGSSSILLKSVEAGSGVAAGGAVRIVMDMVGVADIILRSLGSNTPINVVRATTNGLKKFKTREDVLKFCESAKNLQD